MLTQLFVLMAIIIGIAAAGASILNLGRLVSSEYLAILSVAAFAFAIAAGVWRIAELIEDNVKQPNADTQQEKQRKRYEQEF